MKQYFILATFALLITGCGQTADPHAGHNHSAETADEHAGHDHSKENHDHAAETADEHAGHDHAPAAAEAITEAAHAHQGEITVTVEQAKELGLQFTKISPVTFAAAIPTGGIIEPSTSDNSAVVATSSGIITISQSGLNIGSMVSKGQKLFAISSEKLTGDNLSTQVKIAYSELQKAQGAYTRAQTLHKDNLITASEYENAKSTLETATETYATLSQAQNLTASQGGYITSLDVKNGDFVTQGQPLATISSGKQLVLRANLPATYFDRLSQISSANFTTTYNNKTYSIASLGGRLLSKGNATQTGSYSVPVRFAIDNRAELIPGSAVEVYLTTTPVPNAIAVPIGSLTEEQGAYYVYLKTCVDSYKKQAVTIGGNNGVEVQILSGLKVGETVVSHGAFFVRLASKSDVIPHGHAH